MSYYPKGQHYTDNNDEVAAFEEHNPAPYAGGYDIIIAYGRPLEPDDEICYPHTGSVDDKFDYNRPQYTSYSESSAYDFNALEDEYKSYSRPKPCPSQTGHGPKSEYESEYKRDDKYGKSGTGYGGSGYGSGVTELEHGSGYGRKGSEVGSEYGSSQGRKGRHENSDLEYGSGYGQGGRPNHGQPNYKAQEGEGYVRPAHERPGYGRTEEEDYRKPSGYERHSRHDSHHDDNEGGHGRKKYEKDDSDDDDDEKKQRYKNRQHRKHYDHD